jgi:hypothetical protein
VASTRGALPARARAREGSETLLGFQSELERPKGATECPRCSETHHENLDIDSRTSEAAIQTAFGDGKQTRSLFFVSDLIEGFLRLMASPHGCDPVNLGNPRETSMLELATMVCDMVGVRVGVVHATLPGFAQSLSNFAQ